MHALQSIMHASRVRSSRHGAAAGSSEHGVNTRGAILCDAAGGDRPCWHRRRHNQQARGCSCCCCCVESACCCGFASAAGRLPAPAAGATAAVIQCRLVFFASPSQHHGHDFHAHRLPGQLQHVSRSSPACVPWVQPLALSAFGSQQTVLGTQSSAVCAEQSGLVCRLCERRRTSLIVSAPMHAHHRARSMTVQPVVGAEREVFYRERASSMYATGPFALVSAAWPACTAWPTWCSSFLTLFEGFVAVCPLPEASHISGGRSSMPLSNTNKCNAPPLLPRRPPRWWRCPTSWLSRCSWCSSSIGWWASRPPAGRWADAEGWGRPEAVSLSWRCWSPFAAAAAATAAAAIAAASPCVLLQDVVAACHRNRLLPALPTACCPACLLHFAVVVLLPDLHPQPHALHFLRPGGALLGGL